MASIEKRNGRWRARWREAHGKRRSRTFDRKIDAERWLTKVGHDMLTGAYVDPAAGQVTFRAWAEQWRAAKLHRSSTAAQVESHLRLHVYPLFGHLPLARVRTSDIQHLVNTCAAKPLAPATVEVIYNHVANIFKVAVRDRVLAATPCLGVDLPPKTGDAPLQLLTAEQVAAAAEQVTAHYRAAVILGAGAGLRPAEVLGLTVDRVDFLRRTITVDRQLWTPPSGTPRLEPPKTASSIRVVPVPKFVTDELAAHLARFPSDDFVLRSARGNPVRRQRWNDAWRRVSGTGAVPEWSTPHDLRHFYASLLIAQGLDVKTVQGRLGHRSAVTTLDTYGHLWHGTDERTRDAVGAVLGSVFAAR